MEIQISRQAKFSNKFTIQGKPGYVEIQISRQAKFSRNSQFKARQDMWKYKFQGTLNLVENKSMHTRFSRNL